MERVSTLNQAVSYRPRRRGSVAGSVARVPGSALSSSHSNGICSWTERATSPRRHLPPSPSQLRVAVGFSSGQWDASRMPSASFLEPYSRDSCCLSFVSSDCCLKSCCFHLRPEAEGRSLWRAKDDRKHLVPAGLLRLSCHFNPDHRPPNSIWEKG